MLFTIIYQIKKSNVDFLKHSLFYQSKMTDLKNNR